MKTFFISTSKRDQRNPEFLLDATSGRYGYFHRDGVLNISEKKLNAKGYVLSRYRKHEALELIEERRQYKQERRDAQAAREIAEREATVAACLEAGPVSLDPNTEGTPFVPTVANLKDTAMIEQYHGCGRGTAYVKDNQLIAFHYGTVRWSREGAPINLPDNLPEGCTAYAVMMSCTQVCFEHEFDLAHA